jgi:hypothetical protein
MRFLNAIGEYHLQGRGRCGHRFPTFFHTSHPQLCTALRHSTQWNQTGAMLYGDNKTRSAASMQKSQKCHAGGFKSASTTGYGGHFRAVQSFKYVGDEG